MSLVQNLVREARIVPISNSWSSFLRTYTTLFLTMSCRVIRVDVVGVLAILAAVHFNVLRKVTDILPMHFLVICYLRLA